ncbi:MAG: quinolinate synthase NadA [Theionarchaea archaeon]|nr:quinolinate synthase NadA [Theionarchaea archaeon]
MKTLILAHNYQRAEIQDRADYVGDSLKLCQIARKADCEDIIFCGVDFMAETAAILNPDRRVFVPDPLAHCPMAHRVTAEDIIQSKSEYPDAAVVCYINSTAAVKAVSDTICTSANATEIVNSLTENQVIFTPDRNLGSYVTRFTEKEIIIVPEKGNCATHNQLTAKDILSVKSEHPAARIAVHPECRPEVVDVADYVGGTEGILNYVKDSDAQEFIIGTENGMLYRIQRECPNKKVYYASTYMICPDMKMNTLDKLERVLKEKPEQNLVKVDAITSKKAKKAIDRMFELMG